MKITVFYQAKGCLGAWGLIPSPSRVCTTRLQLESIPIALTHPRSLDPDPGWWSGTKGVLGQWEESWRDQGLLLRVSWLWGGMALGEEILLLYVLEFTSLPSGQETA